MPNNINNNMKDNYKLAEEVALYVNEEHSRFHNNLRRKRVI